MSKEEKSKSLFVDNKYFYLCLYFFVAISIVINIITVVNQSIRLDESQSLWAATKSIPGILIYLSQDVQVPLYEVLLHFWIQLFGNNIIIVRGLSLLFFLVTIPILYKTYREVSSKTLSLVGVTIFALSPFILWYSNEARVYSMFALATCLSHLYFLRLYKSYGEKGKMGYFCSILFGLFSHYFFIFFLITQILYVITALFLNSRGTSWKQTISVHKRFLFRFIGILFIDFIFFLPWAVFFIYQGFASNTQPLVSVPTSYNVLAAFINFLFGFQSIQLQALMVSSWPLIILILFFVFTKKKSLHIQYQRYFVLTAFFPIFLIFLVSLYKPIFLTRYLIFITPSLFFIIAWILMSYSRKTSRIMISIFLGSMLSLLLYQNISPLTPVKENYQGAVNYLDSHAGASDVIAISAPFTIYPIAYSFKGEANMVTIPKWDLYTHGAIPKFSLTDMKNNLRDYSRQYNNIYLVLSYDQGYEKVIKSYFETHYQRLDHKIFSPGLEVDEYRLRYM